MIHRLRLYSGLVLLVFVVGHLINTSLAVVSDAVVADAHTVLMKPWLSLPGTVILIVAAVVHAAAAVWSIFQRRSWKLPAWHWAQTLLGLLIPLVLAGHVIGTRMIQEFLDVDVTYELEFVFLWVVRPDFGIAQVLTLLVVWLHACFGLQSWLALKAWFRPWRHLALSLAVLLPALALAGYIAGGMRARRKAAEEGWLEAFAAEANAGPHVLEFVIDTMLTTQVVYLVGLAAILSTRIGINVARRRRQVPRVTYGSSRSADISPGMTLLEALRMAGIPHASVCGGRGRCSTCRVHVDRGAEDLAAPESDEMKLLMRISAPASVRLACQIRPTRNLAVTPLLPPTATAADALGLADRQRSEERAVAVLFADLRGFTRFSEARLPYDVVFVLNRYREAMAEAIEEAGGVVNEFIGDGIMALFGLDGDIEAGCRAALRAARLMSERLDALNATLGDELEDPLRIGIGIHAGSVIVGEMGYANLKGITVVGDVVNTASRIEGMTKDYQAQLVISEEVLNRGGVDSDNAERHEVPVRGRVEPMTVRVFETATGLSV